MSVVIAAWVESMSAVESKPANDARIKTSHSFSFKPVEDVLARSDLTFFGWCSGRLARQNHSTECSHGLRCAMTLCWDHPGLSSIEIAGLFRMPGSDSVAQTIRRTKANDGRTLATLEKEAKP
jgi:hypothetical protein